MNSPAWKTLRQKVFDRDDRKCTKCGCEPSRGNWLEAHHKHYRNLGHENLEDLLTLCRGCHADHHNKKNKKKKDKKKQRKKERKRERNKERPRTTKKEKTKKGNKTSVLNLGGDIVHLFLDNNRKHPRYTAYTIEEPIFAVSGTDKIKTIQQLIRKLDFYKKDKT